MKQILDKCRNSFLAFTVAMFPEFQVSKHHYIVIELLEKVLRGELKRLCVSLPPRSSKSTLVSEYFPAWFYGHNPPMHQTGKKFLD